MNSYEQTVLELFNFLKSNGYSSYLMTTSGLFYEEAPLIIPNPEKVKRTGWMNHFFTKKPRNQIVQMSRDIYGENFNTI